MNDESVVRIWLFMLARVGILAAAALFALGGNPSSTPGAAALAGNADDFHVSVTPTSGLVDGQTVAVHVDAPQGKVIYQIMTHVCLPGRTIDNTWDFGFVGNYCSKAAVGSGDVEPQVAYTAGQTSGDLTLKVGTGSASWISDTYHPHDITCGPGQPCDLVVQIQVTGTTEFFNAPLCYGAGCPPEPAPASQPPPTTAPPVAGSATSGSTSQPTGSASGTGTTATVPSAKSTPTGGHVASSSSSSGAGDDSHLSSNESATVVAGGPDGPSRGVRVFVAAIVGALCGARIVVVLARVRKTGTTKLGVA